MPMIRKVKNMLEIALGSALMYYAAKEALDIKNSPRRCSLY